MAGVPVFTNDASSTLASGITNVATSLTLVGGGGSLFPTLTGGNWFMATIISQSNPNTYEIIKVTAISGDSFTSITRGREGTTALAWSAGDYVNLQITASSLNTFAAASAPVTSVTAGTNITVTGTAQAPIVNAPNVALLSGANFTGPVTISSTLVTTGVANFNTSSEEFKEHITPLRLSVDKVMQIEPIRYIHKDSHIKMDGLSAENIAELFPDLVMFKDGKPYAINYSGVIPHLVLMVQHLQRRIDDLENLVVPVRH